MTEDSKQRRIREWLAGGRAGPWMMEIHTTDRCNLSCLFCWRNTYGRKEDELSDEKWIEIIKDACEMGLKHLTIVGGGEPLLRLKLVKRLVEITKKHDIEGSIVTNGTLITSEFAKHLVKNEWDGIAFSINGVHSSTDNFLRNNKNAFEMSIKGIKSINYWKKKNRQKKPFLTLHPTINKYNYKEVVDMVKFAHKMKMDIVLLRLVNDKSGKFILNERQSIELLSLIKKANLLANKYGIEFIQEFTEKDLGFRSSENHQTNKEKIVNEKNNVNDILIHCPKPFFEIMISADGITSPCCLICESRFKPDGPGNLINYLDNIKNKRLKDVWYGKTFNLFRKAVVNSLPEPCIKYCTTDQRYRIEKGKLLEDRW